MNQPHTISPLETSTKTTPTPDGFALVRQHLGALPVVNHYLERAGLPALLERYLPARDARVKIPPAVIVRLIVTNLLVGREPLYALGEWAAPFVPALLGMTPAQHCGINDDRAGRALTALFDADRASMLTDLILHVVDEFGINTDELHNDSTSISVSGLYRDADGRPRGGKPTPVITFGHSKDHRPDLKQLVWILTIADDGAVPITYRLAPGNTNDDPTHIPTWDHLAVLLGRTNFLYIADSKLASTAAMTHIHSRGGRFITVLPRSRREDGYFRDWAATHPPIWTEAFRHPARHDEPDQVYSTFTSPLPSAEGHRVIWIHSTAKAARDSFIRRDKIEAGAAAIDVLQARLTGPKCRLKTIVAIEKEADIALKKAGASRWMETTITASVTYTYPKASRGRAAADSPFHRVSHTTHTITAHALPDVIARDATTDGCFPLVTNDQTLTNTEVLAAYRYQPNLERHHHLLKGVQHADPLLLRDPARIEALFCCHFLALVIAALIEREIRTAMADAHTHDIPLYPELRACPSPSAERILEIFAPLTQDELHHNDEYVKTFVPELTDLQIQVLNLLSIPTTTYTARP